MMEKKLLILNLIILFFQFSFSQTLWWIPYDFSKNLAKYKAVDSPKFQAYGVDFGYGDLTKISYYFKIEVTSDDDNTAPFLCFSNIDSKCDSRNQIAKNPNGKTTFIWVKREEINKNDQELFIIIECEKENCDYTVTVEGYEIPTFSPNFVYSYLVGNYNKEMLFKILGTEKNVYMTIALEGSSKAFFSIDNTMKDYLAYRTGKIITFFLESIEDILFVIKGADVGEYLTISVHLVNNTLPNEGLAPNEYLLPNGPEISGYLELNVINKECFPLDLSNVEYKSMNELYITGRIHTKYAWFYLEDEKRNYREEYSLEIIDGQLSSVIKNNGKMNYICFELPIGDNYNLFQMAFSFTLTSPTNLSSLFNYYPPQLTGEIYRRIIPKGEIAFFSGTKNDNTAKKYDYNLYQRKGLTKMYIADCRNYPNCHYSKSELDNLISPKAINKMAIWTTEDDKSSAIGNDKYLIVAYCEDDGNDNSGYCEFETSIFSKGQNIYLVEEEQFSKYVLFGERGRFSADIQNGRKIKLLTFDIMIYSGDVSFSCHNYYSNSGYIYEIIDANYDKYYLSNKVHFVITSQDFLSEDFVIEFKAEKNSFFTIKYEINFNNFEKSKEKIFSGEKYLIHIDPTSITKTKNALLINQFYKNKSPFLATFNELNCKFEVKRGNENLDFFDGYAQEIIYKNNIDDNSDSYQYDIKIVEEDLSYFNHKMCMLYISGYEVETKYEREIVIGENIIQKNIFNNDFKKIRFLYPHSDVNKDLVAHINLIDKAVYKIKFYGNNKIFKDVIVSKTQIIYLSSSNILNICNENVICPIIIEVEYESQILKTNPMLEISIRNVKNSPTYLQKNQFKLDFICGNIFYYLYTDIDKNEKGEITVNFLREYGNLFAKVVRKDQTTIDEEANWKGIYRMPSADWEDSLPFNRYTNKLIVNTEDTENCIEGCFLLISIQLSQIGNYIEDTNIYQFSILTRFTPSIIAYIDIKKIIIQVDEFVIGNIDVSNNERIYELFEVWLPNDSNIVEFDLQSSFFVLYINLGSSRPTTKNAHFILLPPGKDTILSLTKEEILNKAKQLKLVFPFSNSLQDVNLVIGIWTDKADLIDTEIYSFRVHQPKLSEEIPDIILVNTDQKIMCNPKFLSQNEYRCLFVVTYNDEDVDTYTPLFVYGGSINQGAISYIYTKFIERNIYDQYIVKELNNQIPKFDSSEFNSRADGVNYIYTNILTKGKYMFINIMVDKPDPIMIITFMPIYDFISYDLYNYYINPISEQLLSTRGEKLRLNFPVANSVLVDIVTLNGEAEVYWSKEPEKIFILKGAGDRISLSSGNGIDELIIHRLKSNNNDNKLSSMEDPGFLFYISYHLINAEDENNFIEMNYGKSLEIALKDIDFPIVLYSKIGNEKRDLNIAITFKDNEFDQEGEYPFSPLLFSAQLLKEKTIYIAKKDKDLSPSIEKSVIGIYDTSLKTGQIFLSEETLNAYNINEADNPTLYIRIDKIRNFDEKIFSKFSIEAQITETNNEGIPVENVYHYGKLKNDPSAKIYYRLKVDNNRPYMSIQIAFNSDNLDFIVNDGENQNSNTSFIYTEKARGKIHLILKMNDFKEFYYLYIFKKAKAINEEEYLNNFAFKYINGKDESELSDYQIFDSGEISITENKEGNLDIISCTFNKLEIEPEKANITYFFKVVDNSTYFNGEEINTIAVTNSPYYTVYERNPIDNEGKISLIARGENFSNWKYLNVIAQVQKNGDLEYIAYNGKENI